MYSIVSYINLIENENKNWTYFDLLKMAIIAIVTGKCTLHISIVKCIGIMMTITSLAQTILHITMAKNKIYVE